MNQVIRDFLHNESGATAIEYGLIAALIAVAIIAAVTVCWNQFERDVQDRSRLALTSP